MTKIGNLKKPLHGRQRKRMRLAMSECVGDLEFFLAAKKLRRLLQKLLPDHTDHLDFNHLRHSAK